MSRVAKQRVKELSQFISWGRNEEARRLVRDGVSPDAVNEQGRSMVSVAVVSDNREALRMLLDAGASPNSARFENVTSLPLMRMLIDAGFNMNAPCANGIVPLDHAVRTKALGMIRLLLERGVEVPAHMREAEYWDSLPKGVLQAQRVIFAHLTATTIGDAMGGPEDPEPSKSTNAGVSPL